MLAAVILATLSEAIASPKVLPLLPTAQLRFHHAAYRTCAVQRPGQALPALDKCASITVAWPTVVGKPGIDAHLRTHVLSREGKPAAKPLLAQTAQAELQSYLQHENGFAQDSFIVSVVTNHSGLLVVQNKWFYDGAGAHPDAGIQYYTYDTAHDRALTLADLLVAGYAPRLGPLLQQAFGQQRVQHAHSDLLQHASELKPTTNFWPTRQGLRFRYNAGEAGAVAAGPVEVLLTWDQLKPLLRPSNPVRVW